jgi:hypothetical protein
VCRTATRLAPSRAVSGGSDCRTTALPVGFPGHRRGHRSSALRPLPAYRGVPGALGKGSRSVTFGHAPLGSTSPSPPPYAVYQLPPRTHLRPTRLDARRQQGLNTGPLAVRQIPRPMGRDHRRTRFTLTTGPNRGWKPLWVVSAIVGSGGLVIFP